MDSLPPQPSVSRLAWLHVGKQTQVWFTNTNDKLRRQLTPETQLDSTLILDASLCN